MKRIGVTARTTAAAVLMGAALACAAATSAQANPSTPSHSTPTTQGSPEQERSAEKKQSMHGVWMTRNEATMKAHRGLVRWCEQHKAWFLYGTSSRTEPAVTVPPRR